MTPPAMPRKRAMKPKVRSGCITCRQRRIKCDEGKPICLRCQKRGLGCFYQVRAPTKREAAEAAAKAAVADKQPRPILPSISTLTRLYEPRSNDLSAGEAAYLDVYLRVVAVKLAQPELWSRGVLREAARDECVRYALLGIGALTKALYQPGQHQPKLLKLGATGDSWVNGHHHAATCFYNRALAIFRARIAGGGISSRSILMASLCFVVFEILQGSTDTVDKFMAGVIITLQHSLVGFRPDGGAESLIATAIDDEGVQIAESLVVRMAIFQMLGGIRSSAMRQLRFTSTMPHLRRRMPSARAPNAELQRAWSDFYMCAFVWMLHTSQKVHQDGTANLAAVQAEQDALLAQLDCWAATVHGKLAYELDSGQRQGLKLILIGVEATVMFVTTFLDPSEMAWDVLAPQCHSILRLAESVIDTVFPASGKRPVFEDTIIPTIHYIMLKSRDRDVIEHAFSLSRRVTEADANWYAKSMIIARELKVAIEYEGRDANGYIPLESRYSWTQCAWNEDRSALNMTFTAAVPRADGVLVEKHFRIDPDRFGIRAGSPPQTVERNGPKLGGADEKYPCRRQGAICA